MVIRSISLVLSIITTASGLPVQYVIEHHKEECLYEKVAKGESFTVSTFILGGSQLQAHVTVDGPVAPPEANTGLAIIEAAHKYDGGEHYGEPTTFEFHPDFENFNNMDDDSVVDQDEEEDEEDEEQPKEGETPEEQRARRAKERRKALEARQREERVKQIQKKKIRNEGKPIQKTFNAKADGWYQFCVEAHVAKITVEIDFRKQSDYGDLGRDGHVLTLEEKAVQEEEKAMEEDTASKEGIKDEDFNSTREKLKTLRRLLADIQSKQSQERHRLMIHSATNEHSHSRMVLSSLLETILFMLVTGFQVFTIRRWFQGAPALGR
ncbi:hypothetical protein ACA910_012736 [Epithemia clementina (nom. ined.)]